MKPDQLAQMNKRMSFEDFYETVLKAKSSPCEVRKEIPYNLWPDEDTALQYIDKNNIEHGDHTCGLLPVEALQWIKEMTKQGKVTVLDPFAGTGLGTIPLDVTEDVEVRRWDADPRPSKLKSLVT